VSAESPEKSGQIDDLQQAGRRLSLATIMFHQAVADRLGLNPTDHKCIDLLASAGSTTAGELAEATGLTTGAITGVIDRLERAGFARRAPDASDRRKVMIEPDLKKIERRIIPLFDSMGRSAAQLFERYSAAELTLILDFAVRSRAMAEEETRKLREGPEPSPAGKGRRAPRASIKS
jgi:DNA-binding MarR family transcriptional regulator